MQHVLEYAIEFGLKKIAKANMHPQDYERFVHSIRMTRFIHVGNKTLHDVIRDHAMDINDWATDNHYSETSHHVDAKTNQAIHAIKTHVLGWRW
jgi:hypothetical protein